MKGNLEIKNLNMLPIDENVDFLVYKWTIIFSGLIS